MARGRGPGKANRSDVRWCPTEKIRQSIRRMICRRNDRRRPSRHRINSFPLPRHRPSKWTYPNGDEFWLNAVEMDVSRKTISDFTTHFFSPNKRFESIQLLSERCQIIANDNRLKSEKSSIVESYLILNQTMVDFADCTLVHQNRLIIWAFFTGDLSLSVFDLLRRSHGEEEQLHSGDAECSFL